MALEHDFSVIDLNNLRAREFRAEEAAIQAVAEASFTDCLRLAGIARSGPSANRSSRGRSSRCGYADRTFTKPLRPFRPHMPAIWHVADW